MGMGRREFLRASLGAAGGLALAGCTPGWLWRGPIVGNRQVGTVLGIDRANSLVRARLDTAGEIAAAYLRDRMPWPLARAVFTETAPGAWLCLGPIGEKRVVFRDDFTHVDSAADFPYGDTSWTFVSDGGAGAGVTAATGGLGAAKIAAGTVVPGKFFLRKDLDSVALPTAPQALWMSARVATSQSFHNDANAFGLVAGTDVAVTTGIVFEPDILTGKWRMIAVGGGGAPEGSDWAADTFVTFDLVWVGAPGGASTSLGWINGNGPVSGTDSSAPSSMTVRLGAPGNVANDYSLVDWCQLAVVSFVNPEVLELASA